MYVGLLCSGCHGSTCRNARILQVVTLQGLLTMEESNREHLKHDCILYHKGCMLTKPVYSCAVASRLACLLTAALSMLLYPTVS